MDQDPEQQLEDSSSDSDESIESLLNINYEQDENNDLIDYLERFHQPWPPLNEKYLGHIRRRGNCVGAHENIRNFPNPFLTFLSGVHLIEIYYLGNLNEAPQYQVGYWNSILADSARPLLANGLISLLGRLIFSEVKVEERRQLQQVETKRKRKTEVKQKKLDDVFKYIQRKQKPAQSQVKIEGKSEKTDEKFKKTISESQLAPSSEQKQQVSQSKRKNKLKGGPGSTMVFRLHFSLSGTAFEPNYTPTIRHDENFYFLWIKHFEKVYKELYGLPIQDIDADAQEVLGIVENKPTSISKCEHAQEEDIPDDLFTNNHNELPETDINPVHGLREQLKVHQKQALTWLLYREGVGNWHPENQNSNPIWRQYRTQENENVYFCPFTGQNSAQKDSYTGGILADDNGFDEKLTMIALILSNPQPPQVQNQQQIKTTLIITSNQISNWGRTFRLCNLEVLIHRWDRQVENFEKYDVIIMNYYTLMEDWKIKAKNPDNPSIYDYNYYRVILDQSSKIKNYKTKRAQSCLSLKTQYRWCVTSQSLVQNDFMDLVAVLQFINQKQMPCPNSWWFNKYIKIPYEQKINRQAVKSMLKNIMAPLILRRTQKTRYFDGNLMIIIPLINQLTQSIQLDQVETNAYQMMKIQLGEHQYYRQSSKLRKICDYAQMADIRPVVDRINQRKLEMLLPEQTPEERIIFQDLVLDELRHLEICPVCEEPAVRFMVSSCRHYLCKRCYRQRRDNNNLDQCPICQHPNTRYISVIYNLNNEWRNNYIQSSKIKRIRGILDEIPAGDKCVIFTQFLEMIYVLYHDFTTDANPITCYQIHGAMPHEQRTEQLTEFNQAQGKVVLIASLKANEGQDLTRASHVIFVEPWWNFSVQDQAIQRVLVNGRGVQQNQEKITVHRLIAKETIEVRIAELNEERRELINNQVIQDEQDNNLETSDDESDTD